ncbi:MAG: hypothetical protein AB1507_03835 [Bacillota bacterium]
MRKRAWLCVSLIGLLAGLLVGCGTSRTAREATPAAEIMVFAGAGLKDTLPEVAELYRRQHPEAKVSFNFAGLVRCRSRSSRGRQPTSSSFRARSS